MYTIAISALRDRCWEGLEAALSLALALAEELAVAMQTQSLGVLGEA